MVHMYIGVQLLRMQKKRFAQTEHAQIFAIHCRLITTSRNKMCISHLIEDHYYSGTYASYSSLPPVSSCYPLLRLLTLDGY